MVDHPLTGQMKDAMRRLAGSVVIITARHEDRRFAMAATSVQSLSVAPPSLVVCVNRSASIYAALSARTRFCVNILAPEHIPLAEACSGKLPLSERFTVGDWLETEGGVPYLADAQAALLCTCDHHLDYGSHGLFIGLIEEVRTAEVIKPLVYVDGRYIGLTLGGDTHAAPHS